MRRKRVHRVLHVQAARACADERKSPLNGHPRGGDASCSAPSTVGLQHVLLVALEQRHDLRLPDRLERVLASSPVSGLMGRAW
jgi:hypothetical protein